MKNKKFLLVILFFVFLLGLVGYRHFNNTDINRVLKSKSYSYLPVEAKNFIEQVYNDSGEIILTEKNKQENTPYLNPDYIKYLTLSSEEQSEVELIPDIYSLDYIETDINGDNLPSSYDIRNVNGKNFITPLKNQSTLDLCWAFTAVEQAESYLLKTSNTSYSSTTQQLSPRQIDYSLSYDGIYNYKNDMGLRTLGYGGNYFMAMIAMSNGVGLNRESDMPFTTSKTKKYLQDVMPYRTTGYELNSSIRVGTIPSNPTSTQLTNYTNTVKNYIMEYGGVFVATQSPGYSCGTTNTDGNEIIRVDSKCTQDSNHAMQIIGWDDSYSYSYCVSNNVHKPASSCSTSSRITGTGAWLVRNSWGESTDYPYVYLAYDSINYQVDVSTNITSLNNKTWDNNYHEEIDSYYLLMSTTTTQYFKKKIDTPEKIEKIKFYTLGENASYYLSINTNKENYRYVKAITAEHAGLNVVDVSDLNLVVTDSGFNVELYATSGVYMIRDSIEVFTSNVSTTPIIQTNDIYLDSSSSNYTTTLLSDTKEIPSTSTITYGLKNKSGTSYNSYLTTNYNKVANNQVNTSLTINKSIPAGDYILTTTYNNNTYESNISLGSSLNYSGAGTESNPYIINSEEDLKNMSKHLNAFYKLGRDIVLTEEWVPIGTKENPFTGSLNGNGKKISHLVINKDYESNGLFGYVEINSSNTTSFYNIILDDIDINARGNAGALIGTLTGVTSKNSIITASANIQNIYVMDGHVYSYYGHAGAIVGCIMAPTNDSLGQHTYNFNKLFNASSVGGLISTGMIGHIYGATISEMAPVINMYYIENMGSIDVTTVANNKALFFTGSHGTMVGYGINYATVNLNYYFSNAFLEGYTTDGNALTGYLASSITYNKGDYGKSIFDVSELEDLTESSNYSSWSAFSSNWTLSTVNGIKRFPVIKGVPFEYTSINNIEIGVGETVHISDYMSPKINAAYKLTSENVSDENVIEVENEQDSKSGLSHDVEIKGLNVGTSTIDIINFYDGYYKTITVTVTDPNVTTITYHNTVNNEDVTYTQSAILGQSVTLTNNRFSKAGYTFKDWNTKRDGSGTTYQNKATFTLTEDALNLYAEWTPNTYTIKYNSNSGSGTMSDTTATYDQNVTLRKNTFTNTGYAFAGWNTKADGTGTSYSDEASVKNLVTSGTITLYAQWSERVYYISYNGNGSTSGSMSNTNARFDTSVTLKTNNYSRTGYHFTGWNTKQDGTGTSYSNGATVTNIANTVGETVILYAQWAPNTYTIKYNSNNGTGTMSDTTATYNQNVTLRKNTFTNTGYAFAGWNTKADGTGTSYSDEASVKNLVSTDNGSITLYAQWSERVYYISYNGNGSTSGSMSNTKARFDTSVTLKTNNYSRTGYHFTEWNTKQDGTGTSYSNGTTVTNIANTVGETVTLYAQWSINTYKITFNSNGGSGTMANMTVSYGQTVSLNDNTYNKTGYTFNGWNTKSDGTGTHYSDGQSITNLTLNDNETITLYAEWLANTYTIKYNNNGGSGTMSSTQAIYNKQITLKNNTFTRTGYVFSGWNTKQDGTGTSYSNGATVSNLTSENTGIVTLYAQWTPYTYTIVYNANSGSGTMNQTTAYYGTNINLSKNTYTKEGYQFKKWNTKNDGTGTSYNDEASVLNLVSTNNGSITLYAIWDANTYKISFHANGGEGDMSMLNATYDKNVTLTRNAYTRENYVFTGWNTNPDGSGTGYSNGATVKNLTKENGEIVVLYAQWREKTPDDDTYEINYAVDNENMVLDDIPLKTTLEDFRNHFDLGDSYTIEIDLGDKSYIYTGSKVKIYKNNTLEVEYTNVVRGDCNGDAKISALDYVKIKNHIMASDKITNIAYKLAADYNHDDKISALDYVGIKNYIMNGAG